MCGTSRKKGPPRRDNVARLAARLFLTCAVIPGILALLGYIIETAIYIPGRRTYFHTLYITISGWIAAPLILVRWYWRWPMHLTKLEFVIYVIHSVAFFTTINLTSLAGNELYQTNKFVRQQFLSDQFTNISTREDMWNWLGGVMRYVYDRNTSTNVFSRLLPGRLTMLTAIRLRQNRVKQQNCSAVYTQYEIVGSDQCNPAFSASTESRETYGDYLQFPYVNEAINSTTGHPISMEDFELNGEFGRYPLAGFWVWFSQPLTYNHSLFLLDLMKQSNWIDAQTRSVGLDVSIGVLDFIEKPLFAHLSFMAEVTRAGSFAPLEPEVYINNFHQYEGYIDPTGRYREFLEELLRGVNANSLELCRIIVLKDVLRPMFLGFLPFVVYFLTVTIIDLLNDWRQCIKKPFISMELLWCIMASFSVGFQLSSLRYIDCGGGIFTQDFLNPVIGNNVTDYAELRYNVRFEVFAMSAAWTRVRRLLGIAIFIHMFNFLKFLVKLKALGVLVRTLRFAAVELLSFSFSFLILFAGFVIMFYHIFSIESSDFRTINMSISTLWLGMLGELELTPELWRGRNITLALFIIFTFLSAFILLTTIVSIIGKAYQIAETEDSIKKSNHRPGKGAAMHHTHGEVPLTNTEEEVEESSSNEDSLIQEQELIRQTLRLWQRSMKQRWQKGKVSHDDNCPEIVSQSSTPVGDEKPSVSSTNDLLGTPSKSQLKGNESHVPEATYRGGWVELMNVQNKTSSREGT